jgi:hypothetical protein
MKVMTESAPLIPPWRLIGITFHDETNIIQYVSEMLKIIITGEKGNIFADGHIRLQ